MLWVPQKGILRVEHNTGSVGAATPGTSVTTGAAAATKGTPAELIASTAFDAYWITIFAGQYGLAATDSQSCLDILMGTATEEVLIPNLLAGGSGGTTTPNKHGWKRWDFPLYIPAGTRLAAQAAGARVSTAMQIAVYLYGGDALPPFRVGRKVTTYGTGTVPNGTAFTPGASGAAMTFTQMTASTSEDHFALVPSMQPAADTTWALGALNVGFGLGAATEEVIATGYWFMIDAGETMNGPDPSWPTFHDIPSGTRLTFGASHSVATGNPGFQGSIHAVS